MKWYIGLLSELVGAIVGIGSILYIEGHDQISLPISTQQGLIVTVFLVGFLGGFMAPYHVMKTSKYAASAFAILAGIPLIFVLIATGEISNDDSGDFGSAIILILLIVVAIVLVISIVVVTLSLFIGGYVGSIFGKMVFEIDRYDDIQQSQYGRPYK